MQSFASYLSLAFGAACLAALTIRFSRWTRFRVSAAVVGGLLVAGFQAALPTLFRAENGFWLALLVFGIPATAIGLIVGLAARVLVSKPNGLR